MNICILLHLVGFLRPTITMHRTTNIKCKILVSINHWKQREVLSTLKRTAKGNLELTLCTSTVRSSLLKGTSCSAGLRRDVILTIVVSSSSPSSSSSHTLIILRSQYLKLMISACTPSRALPSAAVVLWSFPANLSLSSPTVGLCADPITR